MRVRFDEQLELLNRELIEMGSLCEAVIALACKAIVAGDKILAAKVVEMDNEIDQKERNIESICLKLLLQQQPVAKDLRQISAALKMITDMERIGDQAADIAEIVGLLDGNIPQDCIHIPQMAQASMKMVRESVDAYVNQDVEMAKLSIEHDDVIDDYFFQIKADLIQMIAEKPGEGEYALDLLMIAKYFERIGDHATNIAEWVIFSVTGEHKGEY